MAEAKTKPTDQSVDSFINTISDPQRRQDCFAIAKAYERGHAQRAAYVGQLRLASCSARVRMAHRGESVARRSGPELKRVPCVLTPGAMRIPHRLRAH
jgi:hypothetical protein